ncbi:MFS transporter [Marinovum sp.]|uniref:MFS transporter n=1 Tax=Marinovum sp. TaxID=2024839 RepID=UPI002B266182|nr:MFS transporter [Marinovum sp.]
MAIDPTLQHAPAARGYVLRHALAQLLLWSGFYYLLPAVLPHMLAETGWSDVQLSAAMSAGFLIWALLCPLAGSVIDRGWGPRAMRLAGLAGAGLLLVAATGQSLWLVGAALVLLGAPMAMTLYDPCFSLMIRRFGPAARRPITTVTLIAGLATLLTFPLVAGLSAAGLGWRGIFAAFAGLALVAVLLLPSEPAGGAVAPASVAPEGPAPGARTLVFGLAFALLIFGHAALLFQLPAQLASTRGLDNALLLPMVLGPAQIAGRLLWERLQRGFGLERAALGLFTVMLLPPLLLLDPGAGLWLVLLALLVQGGCYGVHTILRPLLAAHWLPRAGFARRLGSIAMIGLLLMALAPAAAAWVTAALGLPGLLALVFLADLVGLALLAGLVMRARQEGWA